MSFQPSLFDQTFTPHANERTEKGTSFVQDPENRKRISGNCKMLLKYWQRNNIWLNKYDALAWLKVDCLAQRAADLSKNGVSLQKTEMERDGKKDRHVHYRLLCTCRIVGGDIKSENCWAHDLNLKIN